MVYAGLIVILLGLFTVSSRMVVFSCLLPFSLVHQLRFLPLDLEHATHGTPDHGPKTADQPPVQRPRTATDTATATTVPATFTTSTTVAAVTLTATNAGVSFAGRCFASGTARWQRRQPSSMLLSTLPAAGASAAATAAILAADVPTYVTP